MKKGNYNALVGNIQISNLRESKEEAEQSLI
jgi:hypothetical protein